MKKIERTQKKLRETQVINMDAFFKYSPHSGSFIVIIFVTQLWLLFIGSPVLSQYIAPHYFIPNGGCQSSDVCYEPCNKWGYPSVEVGQSVPMMKHLCVDNTCYCSALNGENTDFAWRRGRLIIKYECISQLTAGEGETYEYQECLIHCMFLDIFEEKHIDPYDSTVSDDELIFNIVVNGDCYCGAKPVFIEEGVELPEGDDGDELEMGSELGLYENEFEQDLPIALDPRNYIFETDDEVELGDLGSTSTAAGVQKYSGGSGGGENKQPDYGVAEEEVLYDDSKEKGKKRVYEREVDDELSQQGGKHKKQGPNN